MHTLALLRALRAARDVALDAGIERRSVPEVYAEIVSLRQALVPDDLGCAWRRRTSRCVASRATPSVTDAWRVLGRVYDPSRVTITFNGITVQGFMDASFISNVLSEPRVTTWTFDADVPLSQTPTEPGEGELGS